MVGKLPSAAACEVCKGFDMIPGNRFLRGSQPCAAHHAACACALLDTHACGMPTGADWPLRSDVMTNPCMTHPPRRQAACLAQPCCSGFTWHDGQQVCPFSLPSFPSFPSFPSLFWVTSASCSAGTHSSAAFPAPHMPFGALHLTPGSPRLPIGAFNPMLKPFPSGC